MGDREHVRGTHDQAVHPHPATARGERPHVDHVPADLPIRVRRRHPDRRRRVRRLPHPRARRGQRIVRRRRRRRGRGHRIGPVRPAPVAARASLGAAPRPVVGRHGIDHVGHVRHDRGRRDRRVPGERRSRRCDRSARAVPVVRRRIQLAADVPGPRLGKRPGRPGHVVRRVPVDLRVERVRARRVDAGLAAVVRRAPAGDRDGRIGARPRARRRHRSVARSHHDVVRRPGRALVDRHPRGLRHPVVTTIRPPLTPGLVHRGQTPVHRVAIRGGVARAAATPPDDRSPRRAASPRRRRPGAMRPDRRLRPV